MSAPPDWPQFYQHHQVVSSAADTAVAASSTSMATTPSSSTGGGGGSGTHLSPEGRVSKPARRRSRASRRTPTTLLNTDTANFRAMVQQFTGGPSAPFASMHPGHGAPNISFGLGPRQAQLNPGAVMAAPAYHLQYQQQQYQQQNQQQHMFSVNRSNESSGTDDVFFQRLGNPRSGPNMQFSAERFVMEGGGVSGEVRPSNTGSRTTNENRTNSFMF